ncbi:MAG: hypothetical protein M1833_001272 [Piccolia ochrophora]|nr:MAG: hypothetical protein M1833_001272 [Piccolia ochrophora]
MPYNTRRKSLSLPSLGIQLPQTSRASGANRSPPSTTPVEPPPSKKVKRSHTSPSPVSPKASKAHRPRTTPALDHTPPPSPSPSPEVRIDTQGINDDIVVGVIQQLEATANKPQLVKELAAALCNTLNTVEKYVAPTIRAMKAKADSGDLSSANPQAIISSRLNAYLKRPWTALSPCPIAKFLIPTHPRKIYFYLTNTPHQPLPTPTTESPLPSSRRSIISPSLTSDEDQEARKRTELSPSPEVDLSPPDIEDEEDSPLTPAASFSGRSSLSREAPHVDAESLSRRAVAPPLEGDEREFTRTASEMQSKRSMSLDQTMSSIPERSEIYNPEDVDSGQGHSTPESEEHATKRNLEAAAALFGHASTAAAAVNSTFSSPLVRPATALHVSTSPLSTRKLATGSDVVMTDIDDKPAGVDADVPLFGAMATSWGELRSPENVELDELDDLLGGF